MKPLLQWENSSLRAKNFLIIANHPLDREIITKLKDGLYDIELENNEVVSSIIRSRQEWSSPE